MAFDVSSLFAQSRACCCVVDELGMPVRVAAKRITAASSDKELLMQAPRLNWMNVHSQNVNTWNASFVLQHHSTSRIIEIITVKRLPQGCVGQVLQSASLGQHGSPKNSMPPTSRAAFETRRRICYLQQVPL